MIIKYFSDLHMEFMDRHDQANFIDNIFGDDLADVFVVAGDLTTHGELIEWLHYIDVLVNVPVIYVPGNHEYYGFQKTILDQSLKQEMFNNVRVLLQGTYTHMGVTFAGATGWWDTLMSSRHLYALNDFNRIYDIRVNGNGTTWGNSDRMFFKKVLENTDHVVCVSHNAPSWKSILPQYVNSDINECFANKWDKMIVEHQPIGWIHGHMHNNIEYLIGKTQIVCNPYGYENHEVNGEFQYNGYVQIL